LHDTAGGAAAGGGRVSRRAQRRDKRGRFTTDNPRYCRLAMRLPASAAERLYMLAEANDTTLTAVLEAAILAFDGVCRPFEGRSPGVPRAAETRGAPADEIFRLHRARLIRRARRRRR